MFLSDTFGRLGYSLRTRNLFEKPLVVLQMIVEVIND